MICSQFSLSRNPKKAAGPLESVAAGRSQAQSPSNSSAGIHHAAESSNQKPADDEQTQAHHESIARQNLSMLRDMAPEELASALEEVSSRMTPETLKFLRDRGARKAASTKALGKTSALGAVRDQSSIPFQESSAGDGKRIQPARSSKDPATRQDRTLSTSHHGKGDDPGMGASGTDSEDVLVADPRPEARLRFGLHSQVMGVQPEGEKTTRDGVRTGVRVRYLESKGRDDSAVLIGPFSPHNPIDPRFPSVPLRGPPPPQVLMRDAPPPPQVLMRDALSVSEGAAPEGYTVTELLLLARSSMPNQRALAMRMLADALRQARPSHVHLGTGDPAPIQIPEVRVVTRPFTQGTPREDPP